MFNKIFIFTLIVGLITQGLAESRTPVINAAKANKTPLSLYTEGKIVEAITKYQQDLETTTNPQKRLILLNNFWLALEAQSYRQNLQKDYLKRQNQLETLRKLQQEIRQNRRSSEMVITEALAIARTLPPSRTVGQTYIKAENWQQARLIVDQLPLEQRIPLESEIALATQNSRRIQQLLPKAEDWQRAELLFSLAQLDPRYLNSAITAAQANQADEYLFQLWAQQAQQQPDLAQDSLRLAIASLSRLRPKLVSPHPYTQKFFREKVIPVYRQYLSILLENPTQENLKEARSLFDRLQIAQVENLLNQLCITPQDPSLAQILSKDRGALLQIIVLESTYHVVVTLPSGKIKYTQTKDTQLAEKILKWRQNLKNPYLWDYFDIGGQFYQNIIEPLKESLEKEKVQQLIFILDEDFRLIPPQAFWDVTNQQFLIEQYAISQIISLDFLGNPAIEEDFWVGFGLSQARSPFNTELAYVKTELETIARIIENSSVNYNEQFTLAQMQQQFLRKQPPIVHLATHAQFTGDPQTSLVATYEQNINLFELERLLKLSPIKLLVLSACETSEGNNLATLGLAGMAAQSGVGITLGTLWKASDQSTAKSMAQFYEFLAQGDSVAIALQKTQIEQIQQGSHARNWALFLLLGD